MTPKQRRDRAVAIALGKKPKPIKKFKKKKYDYLKQEYLKLKKAYDVLESKYLFLKAKTDNPESYANVINEQIKRLIILTAKE